MKSKLSPFAVVGILAGVIVVTALGLFFGLRDKPATREINRASMAQQGPPPEDKPMPAWAVEKLRASEAAHP